MGAATSPVHNHVQLYLANVIQAALRIMIAVQMLLLALSVVSKCNLTSS